MFLRYTTRKKNGKEHRYWSIVENKRCAGDRVVQRHVLYLGEINDRQEAAWQKSIEVFEHGQPLPRSVALFASERAMEADADEHIVRVKLSELQLRRPRQWGACWLACHLYQELGLDRFWAERLPPSRKGTRWDLILQTLCAYRLIDPGSVPRPKTDNPRRSRGMAVAPRVVRAFCDGGLARRRLRRARPGP